MLVGLLIILFFLSRQQLNVIAIVVIIVTMVTTLTVTTVDRSATGAGIMYMHACTGETVPFRDLIEFNLFTHLLNRAYQVLLYVGLKLCQIFELQ